MRTKTISLIAASTVLALASSPAAATVTLLDTDCDLATGCLFSGQITDELTSVMELEDAYNTQHIEPPLPATIDLTGLYKTPGSLAAQSGTFTLPGGGLFEFYAVKAGEEFMLYQVAPTNSVEWTTAGLLNENQQPREASHIVAFGGVGAVPEPTTWAMLLVGFFGIGGAMRRRRTNRNIALTYA
jgi:hypothetical protein